MKTIGRVVGDLILTKEGPKEEMTFGLDGRQLFRRVRRKIALESLRRDSEFWKACCSIKPEERGPEAEDTEQNMLGTGAWASLWGICLDGY